MVIIDFGIGDRATITSGEWSATTPIARALLAAATPTIQVSGSHPDPDLAAAEQVVAAVGGTIIHHTEPPPAPDGSVY